MKPRRIDPEEKMAKVVETARRLFVEKGYHKVSIPDIVKASGVSTGAIYHHFSNKENLASHIHEQTMARFCELLSARLVGTSTVYQKLRAFAQLVMDIAENDPVMMEYMLFMKHGEFLETANPICLSQPFRWVQDTVGEGIENGEVRPGDRMVAAITFTGVILRTIEVKFSGVLEPSLQDISEEVISNAWRAIKA